MSQKSRSAKPMISLTYDGAQFCHAETALPHLDTNQLKATFFIDPLNMLETLPIWVEASRNGHEIGNGCLTYCGPIDAWTAEMVADDLDECDSLIREAFPGQQLFSFGYPTSTGNAYGIDYLKRIIEKKHLVCRSGDQGGNNFDQINLAYLNCITLDGQTGDQLIDIVRSAVRTYDYTILAFDGIGSGDPSIDASAHLTLCQWLKQSQDLVQTMTVSGAAQAIRQAGKPELKLV